MPMEKSVVNGSNKEQIITYFKSALRALEEDVGDFDEDIESNDISNALCWSIEAMFLHGMKTSKPNKDFWPIIKRFSHKSSLESIKSFDQIRSDVGRCRSWLRLSINECCLESYMAIIVSEISTMCRYYLPTAFLLDEIAVNLIMTSIKGLSNHQFKLSCNSTVLNQWNLPPLQLAGVISDKNLKWPQTNRQKKPQNGRSPSGSISPSITKLPFLQHLPKNFSGSTGNLNVHSGLCKVSCQSVECLHNQVSPGGHLMSVSIPSSLEKDNVSISSSISKPDFGDARQDFYRTVYDISESEEEDASKTVFKRNSEDDDTRFKHIIQHNLDKYPLNYDQMLSFSNEIEEQLSKQISLGLPLSINSSSGFIDICNQLSSTNPIASKMSPEHELIDDLPANRGAENFLEGEEMNKQLITTSDSTKHTCENSNSDSSILNIEQQVCAMEATERSSSGDDGLITVDKIIESVIGKKPADLANEEVKKKRDMLKVNRQCLHESSRKDMDITREYTMIKHEKGLSSQCFQCKNCSAPIGVFFGRERVCSFDKCYYCPECLDKEEEVIPCRVIFNWDFRPYKVSKKNHKHLNMFKATPFINIENMNPSLYSHVAALNEVKMTRIKLKYLKSYLLNCNLNHVINLHSYLGDLSYYTEDIHAYSMEDLLRVPSGHLLKIMNRACQFGIDHVMSCHLCSQKGFYCEICKTGGVIYPFDLENTVRCDSCKAVYHKNCKTSGRACPKCQRRARKNSSCSEVNATEIEKELSHYPQNSINFSYTPAVV